MISDSSLFFGLLVHFFNVEDVVALCWSPDSTMLATGSLDNEVIVWNPSTQAKLAQLKGHQSFVQGLAWDPLGTYLASSSADKTIRIWNTDDWSEDRTLSKALSGSASAVTFFRRLAWAPDGSFLCGTHGHINQQPVAPLYQRTSWKNASNLVNHTQLVVSAAFCPHLLQTERRPSSSDDEESADDDDESRVTTTLACVLGSNEGGISLWSTALPRPLAVVNDLFEQSVLDVSWGRHTLCFLCCSDDGTIAYVRLSPEEIGEPMPEDRFAQHLVDMYGSSVPGQLSRLASSTLAETPDQLLLHTQRTLKSEPLSRSPAPTASSSAVVHRPAVRRVSVVQQRESITRDGRRRIAPQLITPAGHDGDTPLTGGSAAMASATTTGGVDTAASFLSPFAQAAQAASAEVSSAPVSSSSLTHAMTSSSSRVNGASASRTTASARPPPPPGVRRPAASTLSVSPARPGKRRLVPSSESASMLRSPGGSRSRSRLNTSTSEARPRARAHRTSSGAYPDVALRAELAPPPKRATLSYSFVVPTMHLTEQQRFVQVRIHRRAENENQLQDDYSTIECCEGTTLLWNDRVPGVITQVCANEHFCAVGLQSGQLLVYTPFGRRALPTVQVSAAPVKFLKCSSNRQLLILSCDGMLRIWNVIQLESQFEIDVTSLLSTAVDIEKAELTSDQNNPVIWLTNHTILMYSFRLKAWLQVGGVEFPGSEYSSGFAALQPNTPLGILQRQSSAAGQTASSSNHLVDASQSLQHTVSHIETQLTRALLLRSRADFEIWFWNYVRTLVKNSVVDKLRELGSSLLGPAFVGSEASSAMNDLQGDAHGSSTPTATETTAPSAMPTNNTVVAALSSAPQEGTELVDMFFSSHSHWKPQVLGVDKRALLKDVLPLIRSNTSMQRLAEEFDHTLNELELSSC